MKSAISRRHVLQKSGAAVSLFLLTSRSLSATPRAVVEELRTITGQPHLYHGWPTVARRSNGELLVVSSAGREEHVCPFGRVEIMRSRDEGKTWSFPRVVIDGPIDDRDAGVLETAKGSLLITTFTSIHYERRLKEALAAAPGSDGAWPDEKIRRWLGAHERLQPAEREIELGSWMIRSTDGGRSWSKAYRCPINSPHGPIQLSDGRLLYAGKLFWYGRAEQRTGQVGACESTDDGQSWRWLSEIPTRPGDVSDEFHELHAVETIDGQIIAQIRNHNKANHYETLQTESSDGGKSWSVPHSIGVWGHPSHLLRLRDGRLLMSYGHRTEPLGNQARISEDNGRTWSHAMILSGDGTSTDLGYPSTVELGSGKFLTVWYELLNRPVGNLSRHHTHRHYTHDHHEKEASLSHQTPMNILEKGCCSEAWFKMTKKQAGAVLRQAIWHLED